MKPPRDDPGLRWNQRRNRAVALQQQQPHAAELLVFYRKLIKLQEPLFRRTLTARWLNDVTAQDGDPPLLRLERLPFDSLRAGFHRFVRDATPVVTETLQPVARELHSAHKDTLARLMEDVARRRDCEELASRLACQVVQLEFFPRVFLQPVVEAVVERLDRDVAAGRDPRCPWCGWPPLAGVLRDEPEQQGRRLLVCSLCSGWWPFPRTRCANCDESRPDHLTHHISESLPHMRIEECTSCGTYLKTVDLRENGNAVPLVDELASIELDLWCEEQKLTKIQRNVLGL